MAAKGTKPANGPRGKFENKVVERLVQGLSMGMPYEHAAIYAGVSKDTFDNWRNGKFPRGVTKEERAEFREKIEAAEGQGIATKFGIILRAANGEKDPETGRYIQQPDWRAATWMLERRYPEVYGRSAVDVRHRGDPEEPVKVEVENNTDALLERIERLFSGMTEQEQMMVASLDTKLGRIVVDN